MDADVRLLRPGDEARLFTFLERDLDSSVALLSNAERAGLEDRGEPFQGTWVARVSAGTISALAAHFSSGNLFMQGDAGLEDCAVAAVRQSGRRVAGLIGPVSLVERALSALGLAHAKTLLDLPDLLFALDLDQLRVPPLLGMPGIECRPPTAAEVQHPLAGWGAAYSIETLRTPAAADLERRAGANMETWRKEGRSWVLLRDGEIVSYTGFNARARGIVQVGGVWTPHALRGNGYARTAVAGSLIQARNAGARRSTLFTGRANHAAIRAYTSLGYQSIGDWAVLLFAG